MKNCEVVVSVDELPEMSFILKVQVLEIQMIRKL